MRSWLARAPFDGRLHCAALPHRSPSSSLFGTLVPSFGRKGRAAPPWGPCPAGRRCARDHQGVVPQHVSSANLTRATYHRRSRAPRRTPARAARFFAVTSRSPRQQPSHNCADGPKQVAGRRPLQLAAFRRPRRSHLRLAEATFELRFADRTRLHLRQPRRAGRTISRAAMPRWARHQVDWRRRRRPARRISPRRWPGACRRLPDRRRPRLPLTATEACSRIWASARRPARRRNERRGAGVVAVAGPAGALVQAEAELRQRRWRMRRRPGSPRRASRN